MKYLHIPTLFFILFFSIISIADGLDINQNTISNPPEEFQTLYDALNNKLDNLNTHIDSKWNQSKHSTVFSTELLIASPNRGSTILEPKVFEALKLHLNAYQQLGITGVSMDIKYPFLVPSFARSAEYLAFFKNVTEEIRKRNFTLLIAVQTAFTDSIFGTDEVDYTGLTMEQYKQEKLLMVKTIIDEMHPDYLTLETEPATQARNTGLNFSVENVTDIVNFILDSLDQTTTLIGAGAGTWDGLNYITSLSENTAIDYLDVHIYPINNDLVIDRIETIQQTALTNNKKIVIGECWLYKQSDDELTNPDIDYLDIFPRDVYDFWIPLDEKFINMMVNLSHYLKFDFTSLFWMRYFWSYIPYNDTTKTFSPTERYALVDQILGPNMLSGTFTQTGQTYQQLIREDTGVEQSETVKPESYILHQNFPNPFNPYTTIHYRLPVQTDVSLMIIDNKGRQIRTLKCGNQLPGSHNVIWDGKDNLGNRVSSGIYFYRLKSSYRILEMKKMVLIK
jgi:hypothetical protein